LLSTSARHLSRRLLLAAHRHGLETAHLHCADLPARALWVLRENDSGMAAGVAWGGHADVCHDCGAGLALIERTRDALGDSLTAALRRQDEFDPGPWP
jgi:hypothetical protein